MDTAAWDVVGFPQSVQFLILRKQSQGIPATTDSQVAHAYTPGLEVARTKRYRTRRVLPIQGEVLVQAGDHVEATDVVARANLPGDVTPVNLSNILSAQPGEIPGLMLKHEGDRVAIGEVIARSKGIFGLFRSEYEAKHDGTIETISNVTGQMLLRGEPIPVEVRAFATGEVVEVLQEEGCVVEADVTYIQGIFGIGGEAFGKIRMAGRDHSAPLTPDQILPDMRGQIIVGGGRIHGETVQEAIDAGVAAIVSGGIDDADLREILGYDLGVAITGTERIGLTLVITEGFGEIAMARKTFDLLASREGSDAAVNGATQIRAGVIRPEIVIPLAEKAAESDAVADHAGVLDIGTEVRVIRDPYFGKLGTVASLPSQPQALESGSKARVVEVACESGENVIVPRANVEIVSG